MSDAWPPNPPVVVSEGTVEAALADLAAQCVKFEKFIPGVLVGMAEEAQDLLAALRSRGSSDTDAALAEDVQVVRNHLRQMAQAITKSPISEGPALAHRALDRIVERQRGSSDTRLTEARVSHRGVTARCEITDDSVTPSHVIVRLWISPRHDGDDLVPAFEAYTRAAAARADAEQEQA